MHYLSYYPEWPFKKKNHHRVKWGWRDGNLYIYKKEATNRVFLGHPHKHQINNLGEIKKKTEFILNNKKKSRCACAIRRVEYSGKGIRIRGNEVRVDCSAIIATNIIELYICSVFMVCLNGR